MQPILVEPQLVDVRTDLLGHGGEAARDEADLVLSRGRKGAHHLAP